MLGNVQVAIRIRPLNQAELREGGQVAIKADGAVVLLQNDSSYAFDSVFDYEKTQAEVSERIIGSMLQNFLQGYNCTVFAYGQTGSGKTYTMGVPDSTATDFIMGGGPTSEKAGIVPRFIQALFASLSGSEGSRVAKVRLSFLEVYNETLRDLLSPQTDPADLQIRESRGQIIVTNLSEVQADSAVDAVGYYVSGGTGRVTATTNMNEQSSRSHSLFTIRLETISEGVRTSSKFTFVDLAGSERIKRSGVTDLQLRELININSGLLALGNVISALVANQRTGEKRHVPYRDSKLTRLLQDSLGGNTCTFMIACVSPSTSSFDETNGTVLYAARARNIINKPVASREEFSINVAQDQIKALIEQLEAENRQLQDELLRVKGERDSQKEEIEVLEQRLAEATRQVTEMAANTLHPTQESASHDSSESSAEGTPPQGVDLAPEEPHYQPSEEVRAIVHSFCTHIEQHLGPVYMPSRAETSHLLLDHLTDYICYKYLVDPDNYNDVLSRVFYEKATELCTKRPRKTKGTSRKRVSTGRRSRLKGGKSRSSVTSPDEGIRVANDDGVLAVLNAMILLRRATFPPAEPDVSAPDEQSPTEDTPSQDPYNLAYQDLLQQTLGIPQESSALYVLRDLIKRLHTKEATEEEIYQTAVTAMMELQKQQDHILELEGQIAFAQHMLAQRTSDDEVSELRQRIETLEQERAAALEELRRKEQIQLAVDQVQSRFTSAHTQRRQARVSPLPVEAGCRKPSSPTAQRRSVAPAALPRPLQPPTAIEKAGWGNKQASGLRNNSEELAFLNIGPQVTSVPAKPRPQPITGRAQHLARVPRPISELDRKLDDLVALYCYDANEQEQLRKQVNVLEADQERLRQQNEALLKKVADLEGAQRSRMSNAKIPGKPTPRPSQPAIRPVVISGKR